MTTMTLDRLQVLLEQAGLLGDAWVVERCYPYSDDERVDVIDTLQGIQRVLLGRASEASSFGGNARADKLRGLARDVEAAINTVRFGRAA